MLATHLRVNVGSNIGQYRIVRKIGAGGMGSVFVGEHILLGRRAAIKTLLPALSVQREIVDRFFTEARATSAISDPGVVQIFDFGYHVDGTAYIVLELLEGESLAARLDRLGKLPIAEALRIARQVAGALAAAHAQDIVHRDLKPENIFLIHDAEAQGGERAKILDFGICKLGLDDSTTTQSGAVLGTPVYMSPEQCRGAGGVDQRADIYALGCGLFHMLTGRPPFECEGAGDFIVAHLQTPAPAPSTFNALLPEAVDELVLRCLKKAAEDRFQTMAELQIAIEAVLGTLCTPTAIAIPVPALLALGPGYKSSYDANFGTRLPTKDTRANRPRAFPTPTPTTLGSANGQSRPTMARRTGRRALLALLVLVGMFGGLVATRQAIGDDDSDSDGSLEVSTAEAATPNAVAQRIALVAPVAAVDDGTAKTVAREAPQPVPAPVPAPAVHDVAPVTVQLDRAEPTVAKPTRAAQTPRITKQASSKQKTPRPRLRTVPVTAVQPPVPQPAPVPQKPAAPATEDLYDTR